MPRHSVSWFMGSRLVRFLTVLAGAGLVSLAAIAQDARPPVKVVIQQENKTEEVETLVQPVDTTRVTAQPTFVGAMSYGLNVDGNRLTFGAGSAHTTFKIDDQITGAGVVGQPLPPGKNGKQRIGQISVHKQNGIEITQIMEVVPGRQHGKPQPGQKRKMDTLLVRYIIENKDTRPHKIGVRMHIDTYCRTNDGCLFGNPEVFPNRILDGVELKGKDVPPWIMQMEQPNLQNPGYHGYFTFRCGNKLEPPDRVVLTSLGAGDDGWNVPAIMAGGDSAVAFYWEPTVIQPNGKREMAFAQGGGIAAGPENEGRVKLAFGGSFEPGKAFTIAAYVDDPMLGQNLTLELPEGMARIEGKETQPVPPLLDQGPSMVLWKAQVLKMGTFPLRVRSSNGHTVTSNITISEIAAAPKGASDFGVHRRLRPKCRCDQGLLV